MREVSTCIQSNCFIYPPWKTGALRRSRPIYLGRHFSKFFLRVASNEGRLADSLSTQNCFFFATTGLTGTRFSLFFLGLDTDRLQQASQGLYSSIYQTFPAPTKSEMRTVGRGAASPTGDVATIPVAKNAPMYPSLCSFAARLSPDTI